MTGLERIVLGCGNFGGIGSAPEFFGQGESEDEALAIAREWPSLSSQANATVHLQPVFVRD